MATGATNSTDIEWDELSRVLRAAIDGFFQEDDVKDTLGQSDASGGKVASEECLYPELKKHIKRQLALASANYCTARPPYSATTQLRTTYEGSSKIIRVAHDNTQAYMDRPAHPNLVVHVPGTHEHNLLVVELRRQDQQVAFDMIEERKKLDGYVKPELRY